MSDGRGPQRPPAPELAAPGLAAPGPPEGYDEFPTIPPAPRGGPALRWAVPEPLRGWEGHRPADAPTRQVPGLAWTEPGAEQPYEPAGPGPVEWEEGEPVAEQPVDETRRPRRRAGPAVLVVVAIASLASGTAAVVAHFSRPGPAAAFEQLLEDSARAHTLVEAAVRGACQEAAPGQTARAGSMADLKEAVSVRSGVLGSLASGRAVEARLPHGVALFKWLGALTVSSIQADRDYETWAANRSALGCYSGATNDLYYQDALRAAATATADMAMLEKAWAGVAPSLGMPTGLAANVA